MQCTTTTTKGVLSIYIINTPFFASTCSMYHQLHQTYFKIMQRIKTPILYIIN